MGNGGHQTAATSALREVRVDNRLTNKIETRSDFNVAKARALLRLAGDEHGLRHHGRARTRACDHASATVPLLERLQHCRAAEQGSDVELIAAGKKDSSGVFD